MISITGKKKKNTHIFVGLPLFSTLMPGFMKVDISVRRFLGVFTGAMEDVYLGADTDLVLLDTCCLSLDTCCLSLDTGNVELGFNSETNVKY